VPRVLPRARVRSQIHQVPRRGLFRFSTLQPAPPRAGLEPRLDSSGLPSRGHLFVVQNYPRPSASRRPGLADVVFFQSRINIAADPCVRATGAEAAQDVHAPHATELCGPAAWRACHRRRSSRSARTSRTARSPGPIRSRRAPAGSAATGRIRSPGTSGNHRGYGFSSRIRRSTSGRKRQSSGARRRASSRSSTAAPLSPASRCAIARRTKASTVGASSMSRV